MTQLLKSGVTITLISFFMTISAQGPNAPEAASFEPVDATDMVNLVTGDLSYVLPLLNIPSPEGGYPIALSYHAGIAMDQEASWVGLGWNLNPGAINRSLNGYPDDYNETSIWENFYDEGGTETVSFLNFGYSNTAFSTGLDFSWGSNKAFGGSVNIGAGFNVSRFASLGISASIGESNSVGLSVTTSGLSIGAGLSDNGSTTSIGYNSNGSGFSMSSNGSISFSLGAALKNNNSLGLNFNISRNGIGINGTVKNRDSKSNIVGGTGLGANFSFANTANQGDFVVNQSGWMVPLIIPTKAGIFSIAFGKNKYEWYLNKTNRDLVYGPLSIAQNINTSTFCLDCTSYQQYLELYSGTTVVNPTGNAYQLNINTDMECFPYRNIGSYTGNHLLSYSYVNQYPNGDGTFSDYRIEQRRNCVPNDDYAIESVMDIYEFPLLDENITKQDNNNLIFLNNDNYNVTAQGISGSIAPKNYENGNLFGYSKNNSEFEMSYALDGSGITTDSQFRFDDPMNFYFENEFSTYLGINPATFDTTNSSYSDILDYHDYNNPNSLGRRKTSKHVEYFTNSEIHNNTNQHLLYKRGYIKPNGFDQILNSDPNGIGAFTVVGSNGKKYHYSIPVYNKMTVTRNTGMSKDGITPKPESRSYFERIQDTPYATHWLLTAITGPDYIDINNNGQVDENDYGYWVEFDYGKWSEAYGWKAPYGEDYIKSKDDDDYKSTIKGYKQMYYLDKIKTRTHTAIFAKSLRHDNKGQEWQYKSVNWFGVQQNSSDYNTNSWFTLPEQKALKLDKIYLFKNEDLLNFSKNNGNIPNSELTTATTKFPNQRTTITTEHYLNRENNIINVEDLSESLISKSLKSIHLEYSGNYSSLVRNTPNTLNGSLGRLTLKNVSFLGKSDQQVMPPYSFRYHNEENFNIDKKNNWGYYQNKPWMWSMNEVKTPLGTKIKMEYESDDFYKPAFQNNKLFTRFLNFQFLTLPTASESSPSSAPEEFITIKVTIDDEDPMYDNDINSFKDYFEASKPIFLDLFYMGFINYKQGCKINNQRWSKTHIDIYEQWGTIAQIVDEGESYQDANGNDILSSETFMTIVVKAKSPFSRGNSIVGDHQSGSNASGNSIFSFDNASGLIHDCYPSDMNHNNIGFKRLENHTNQKINRYSGYWLQEANTFSKLAYSLQFKLLANKEVKNVRDGDLRVKKMIVTDGMHSNISEYFYNAPTFSNNPISSQYRSSGTVSYLPGNDNYQVPYGSELPAPKIMYEYVTLESKDNTGNLVGREIYKFNTFKEKDPNSIKFGEAFEVTVNTTEPTNTPVNTDVDVCEVLVEDNLSSVGQLLEYSSYNNKSQLIFKSTNTYYGKNEYPDNQGVDQLSYQTYKEITYNPSLNKNNKWLINSTTRRNYSNALKSSSILSGSYKQTTNYTLYDEISGATLESELKNSLGLKMKTETIPAYHIDDYSSGSYSMGSKVDNITNKNMLTQQAMTKTYIEVSGQWKETGVGITTWNNNWEYPYPDGTLESIPSDGLGLSRKVWRKHKTFIWEGSLNENGTYQDFSGADDNFNWSIADAGSETVQTNSDWKNISTTTLYDHYSMPLEVRDINNNYASTKMANKNSKIISSVNSRYQESIYTGGEYGDEPQVNIPSFLRTTDYAHTGKYSIKIPDGFYYKMNVIMPKNKFRTGNYKISFWAHKDSYQNVRVKQYSTNASEQPNGEITFAGDWVQINHYLYIFNNGDNDSNLYIHGSGGDAYIDDFRIHPIASTMTSYVYNEWDELSYILGSNNLGTHYEYDSSGRLIKTYAETIDSDSNTGGFKLVKEIGYSYKSNTNFNPPVARNPLRINLDRETQTISACVPAEIGSANLMYKWAQGTSPNELVYQDDWTTENCLVLNIGDCKNTFYKIAIRNTSTGVTREWTGNYFHKKGCPENDNGSGLILIDKKKLKKGVDKNFNRKN